MLVADGASWHEGPENTELCKDSRNSLLPWPPNSPDLNAIENLWSTVKHRLRKVSVETEQRLYSAQELFEQAVMEWGEKLQETIDGLIKRIHTKWQNKP